MNAIIEINHLKKYFKKVKAVDDISFQVKQGELFAFLGLNGAGKSTTISIMCGQLEKDSGSVMINGTDIDRSPDQIKANLGIVFQNSLLDGLLTVSDNLKLRAALYGICGAAYQQRIQELSKLLSLQDLLKRPVGKLSGGQRRRIDIARALLHDPKILILDEPTTGLDPQSRIMVWDTIEYLRKNKGLTVFLTTHYMEEAAQADFVVLLDSGKIAAEGTPNDLKNRYTGDFIKLYGIQSEALKKLGLPYSAENGYLKLAVPNTAKVKEIIASNPELFEDFEVIKGNMDDVFLAVTGKKLHES